MIKYGKLKELPTSNRGKDNKIYPWELLKDINFYFIWPNHSIKKCNSIRAAARQQGMKVSCRMDDDGNIMVIRVK